ncbi:MAG: calcium/sodium antiporter [Candidatus Komeilibacteria bacterium]
MLTYLLFIVGFILLIKGADLLVNGSSSLAKKFHIPEIVIGLTIVSFGTSLPELIVNILAALQGSTDIGLGTIIGSNISNIALVLGFTAIILPLAVKSDTAWKEIPFSILATIIMMVVVNDHFFNPAIASMISRIDGLIFLIFFGLFVSYTINIFVKHKNLDISQEQKMHRSGLTIFFMIVAGLIALFYGGQWVVNGAVKIAQLFGISEFIIAATIIAVGTSLPELVTSIVAAYKKNLDLAVGNIIGSNIFNILFVLGITAVIKPIATPTLINIDILYLIGLSIILFAFLFIGKKKELERWQGVSLLIIYVGYVVFLIMRG